MPYLFLQVLFRLGIFVSINTKFNFWFLHLQKANISFVFLSFFWFFGFLIFFGFYGFFYIKNSIYTK